MAIDAEFAEAKPCRDPECSGTAEVDMDGSHKYWSCTICGYEFGWELEKPTEVAGEGESCSVGVPMGMRQLVSTVAENAAQSVDLGATIGKRAGL